MRFIKGALTIVLAFGLLLFALSGCVKDDGSDSEASPDTTDIVDSPTGGEDAFDYSAGLAETGFFDGITASDYVALPDYIGIRIDASVLEADEDEVQGLIYNVLSRYAVPKQITDRAVEDGDTINIDYVGSIDGVEFDGGNTRGAGATVTIGVTNYIDDFLEQLIGHMPGENFDIEVTFPTDYGKAELNGKDAVFNITINYIEGEDELPDDLTDEIAVDNGFSTADELKAYIVSLVISQQKIAFIDTLFEDVVCSEIPDAIMDHVIGSDIANCQNYAARYGADLDTFLKNYAGYESKEAYIEGNAQAYSSAATYYLIVQAIAESEGLIASDDDITNFNYESFAETYGKPYIKMYILQEHLVPDYIFENAVMQ